MTPDLVSVSLHGGFQRLDSRQRKKQNQLPVRKDSTNICNREAQFLAMHGFSINFKKPKEVIS